MTGSSIPGSLQEITPLWLSEALERSGAGGGAHVTAYSAEPVADETGFMNQLFRLHLEYDSEHPDAPRTIMVKLPSTDPLIRTVFDKLQPNLREARFYKEVAGGSRLQTPRSYFCGTDPAAGHTVLLLEDLSDTRQGDSVAGCSRADAEHVMEQLAAFHASWWNNPRLDELDWMPSRDAESRAYQEIYTDAWQSFLGTARDVMPEGLRSLGDRLITEIPKIKAMLAKPPRTIVHGDLRLDNCFFPSDAGARWPVVFDWEFCVRGRGVNDVATFVSDTYAPQERRDVEKGLLHTYHAALVDNGVSGYSFEECLRDYRISMLEVVVFWIVIGGYCDYSGERAALYLRNSLERFDAAISDLASAELLAG
ncbi:MAG: phosphotransferase [Chloroflexi bacterium]|nr:phosphotransferase [Chloroflexota bacterium]